MIKFWKIQTSLAVEIDIDTFNKIEEILENHRLYRLMKETDESESLTLSEAKCLSVNNITIGNFSPADDGTCKMD